MFMIDMDEGKIVGDKELKEKIASEEDMAIGLREKSLSQINSNIALQNIMTTSIP